MTRDLNNGKYRKKNAILSLEEEEYGNIYWLFGDENQEAPLVILHIHAVSIDKSQIFTIV